MKAVIDIECNSLTKPTQIWLIVCKDIDTGAYYIYRNVTTDEQAKRDFLRLSHNIETYIGHNFLGYDYPVLHDLLGFYAPDIASKTIDTLVVSKMVDYSREGHSIAAYGQEFGLEKIQFNDWTKWSQQMEDYCVRDVDICHKIYTKYRNIINDPLWRPALSLEHSFQLVVNRLHDTGFSFNTNRAITLLSKVEKELAELDKKILEGFPPRLTMVREITPKETKHGSLSRKDFRWVENGDLSDYNGGPFCRCAWQEFNPASHKQIIAVLASAGWKPIDRTQTHIDTERELQRLKYHKTKENELDIANLSAKIDTLKISGWKINENNLSTLPPDAPSPARSLARRILIESRRRTLTEWLGLVHPDTNRIHGKFYGIGAWTHRMAHQQPNTANIPTDVKLYGTEMRSLWRAPRNRLLVGVDAEGIQLRIFAHYINDPEFTEALVKGKKEDKSDPHSLNQRILGNVCGSRQIAKRFIYALLLGAGIGKLAEILGTSENATKAALQRLMERYQGFVDLKENVIPNDARRGWFTGLDGRRVRIPGETPGQRKHLCMSGYLQNGEAIIMKRATLKWEEDLIGCNSFLVNLVHDEWQTETPNDMAIALQVAKLQADSLRQVGEDLKLRCPLAGSYWNEDKKDYTIGTNWSVTH
jgi:DNA polymerase-1